MTEDVLSKMPDDQARRVAEIKRHAEALADRIEHLPVPKGRGLQAARQERLRALHWAITAGAAFLDARVEPDTLHPL